MEMSCLRRILGVTRRERIRNETVGEILHQKETAVDIIQKRLQWFGHVTRMGGERIPARAMHSYIKGNISRGRQLKRWLDNVREDLKQQNLNIH